MGNDRAANLSPLPGTREKMKKMKVAEVYEIYY